MAINHVNRSDAHWQQSIDRTVKKEETTAALHVLAASGVILGAIGLGVAVYYAVPFFLTPDSTVRFVFSGAVVLSGLVGGVPWLVIMVWSRFTESGKKYIREHIEEQFSASKVSKILEGLKTKDYYKRQYEEDTGELHFSKLVERGFISEQASVAMLAYRGMKIELENRPSEEKVPVGNAQVQQPMTRQQVLEQKFQAIQDLLEQETHIATPRSH